MSQFFQIHPANPQPRLIRQAVEVIHGGGVIAYPTDSSYALGCRLEDKLAMERIRRIRRTDKQHNFTLVCRDLSEIASYARVDNIQYRLLKAATPGPFTFILRATSEVPRRLQHPRKKTIGIRIPDNKIVQSLLEVLGEPIMSSTLILPDDTLPLNDPAIIGEQLNHELELIIDGGPCSREPTTVVDLVGETPQVMRQGRGDISAFL